MALVPMKPLLEKALEKGYAVPAVTFYTLDDAQAILSACEELHSSCILMAGPVTLAHNGLKSTAAFAKKAAESASVPVALHLDHAKEERTVLRAIAAGFSSVMIDGSLLSYEKNVALTHFIVRVAGPLGITVEGEIGRVGMGEDGEFIEELLTTAEDAVSFVEDTGIDAVAVAVGTAHGMVRRDARIRYDRIDEIGRAVSIPIVLHGASGLSDEDLATAAKTAICKINIATRLRMIFLEEMRKQLSLDPDCTNQIPLLEKAMLAQTEEMKSIITVLGAAGSAG